jgi:hypothetical protein
MDGTSGTITDPLWADVVIGLFAVLAVMTVVVILETLVRTVVRRWREAGAVLDQAAVDVELQRVDVKL